MFVGKDLDRVDALGKVLGQVLFSADVRLDGMLFACVLRSERPHARIMRIDASAALSLPVSAPRPV